MIYFGNIVRKMLVILWIFFMASPLFAGASDTAKNRAGVQAERGLKNILLGWTDIPKSVMEVTMDSGNPVWGLAAGTFQGIGRAFPRTVSGISDVVTSPAANCNDTPVRPHELNTQIR